MHNLRLLSTLIIAARPPEEGQAEVNFWVGNHTGPESFEPVFFYEIGIVLLSTDQYAEWRLLPTQAAKRKFFSKIPRVAGVPSRDIFKEDSDLAPQLDKLLLHDSQSH